MNVRELIAELSQADPELEVWLSDDDEGNGFRKYCEPGVYIGRTEDGLEIYDTDDPDYEYNETDKRVVVLW